MKRSPRPRATAELSKYLNHQLNMYALAASAAAAGILATAQPAEGKIVYTPAHKTIGVRQHLPLDLNHDRTIDLTISRSSSGTGDLRFSSVEASPYIGNAAVGSWTSDFGGPGAFALRRGKNVGPKQPFGGQLMALVQKSFSHTYIFGQWPNAGPRYLGIKFRIHGKRHYGWVRLKVVTTKHSITSVTLTGYAYETVPNKPITAGKTKGPDVITVRANNMTGTLGHLALGRN